MSTDPGDMAGELNQCHRVISALRAELLVVADEREALDKGLTRVHDFAAMFKSTPMNKVVGKCLAALTEAQTVRRRAMESMPDA